jgi:hypothetical protein
LVDGGHEWHIVRASLPWAFDGVAPMPAHANTFAQRMPCSGTASTALDD